MSDADFMRRALSLAASGVGLTGDNPSVGCVIVRDGVVIAEARTADGGRPHAEEQAIAGADARGATAFVTLEPCAKRSTGAVSCSEVLVGAGVTRVVVAIGDPHPLVAGAGLALLRDAGVQIEEGLLANEARAINADFFAKWGAT